MPAVRIDRRFRGPPASGNGGYVCGVVARHIGPSAVVTLRRPIPLDTDLSIELGADGAILRSGDDILAEGRPERVEIGEPRAVSFDAAQGASDRVADGDRTHPLPGCFVCGPERAPGDGLRIRPGPLDGAEEVLAAPWRPGLDLCDPDGRIAVEFVWAALDCPSVFAATVGEASPPMLLGRLAASVRQRPRAGEPCVVTAWPTGRDGRKLYAAAALFGADGALLAGAQATWILVSREVLLGIDGTSAR